MERHPPCERPSVRLAAVAAKRQSAGNTLCVLSLPAIPATTTMASAKPWKVLLQQVPGGQEERQFARTTSPMRMGGLGMISAAHCVAAAYWASWADALPMIGQRNPEVAEMAERTMEGEQQFPEGRVHGGTCSSQFSTRPRRFLVETKVARTPPQRPPESTVGSVRRLPFLIRTSGRQPCCWPAPPCLVHTFGHTQATMQAPPWLTRQVPRRTSSFRICSFPHHR